jgi:hypothetical protein
MITVLVVFMISLPVLVACTSGNSGNVAARPKKIGVQVNKKARS